MSEYFACDLTELSERLGCYYQWSRALAERIADERKNQTTANEKVTYSFSMMEPWYTLIEKRSRKRLPPRQTCDAVTEQKTQL